MIIAVNITQEKKIPISAFAKNCYPIYTDKINGNFIWDIPKAHMCYPGCTYIDDIDSDNNDNVRRQRRWRKKPNYISSCRSISSFLPDHPDSQSPLSIYNKGLRFLTKERKAQTCSQHVSQNLPQAMPVQSCITFSSTSASYQDQFLPFKKQTDPQTKVTAWPFIQTPVTFTRKTKKPHPLKVIFSWQTQNAKAQNIVLQQIDEKMEHVAH